MNNIFIETKTQFGNSGDQLINRSLLDVCRQYGEVILNDSSTPDWYLDEISGPSDKRYSSLLTGISFYKYILWAQLKSRFSLRANKKRIFLFLPPGHISREGIEQNKVIKSLYLKLAILHFFGVKIIRVGFSIGPFDEMNRKLEIFGSKKFSCYGLRDAENLQYARDIGLSNISFCPDMAWAFNKNQMQSKQINVNRTGVILSFRSNTYGTVHDDSYTNYVIEKIIPILQVIGNKDTKISVCYQVEFDRAGAELIFERLSKNFNVELIPKLLSVEDAFEVYRNAEVVISNRLHVLLLTGLAGALPLALINTSHNRKIASIFADNGLSDCIIDTNSKNCIGNAHLHALLQRKGEIAELFNEKALTNSLEINRIFDNFFS